MEKFVRHERPFLFAPEGAVFIFHWNLLLMLLI